MLTVAEAARRLSISTGLVYSLVAARKIRFCRVGNGRGRIRIPADAIQEYLDRCTFGIKEEKPPPERVRLKHLRL